MPVQEATRTVPSLKMLASQQISLARARAVDYDFQQNVIREKDVPEYNGFNTRASQEQGQSIHPATKAIYTLLIDMVPSEPDTIMTAMKEAQKLTLSTGQAFTLFTNDQQLYRVAVHVLWVYPDKFPNFIPSLGGMHTLMSFIGAVGPHVQQWLGRNLAICLRRSPKNAVRKMVPAKGPSVANGGGRIVSRDIVKR